jgi:hypothetical protein
MFDDEFDASANCAARDLYPLIGLKLVPDDSFDLGEV